MQDFKIKKRIPNIILGIIFWWLAIYFASSFWAYIFAALGVLVATFTDQVIKFFQINLHEKINVGESLEMEIRDKDGNIKGKYKSE